MQRDSEKSRRDDGEAYRRATVCDVQLPRFLLESVSRSYHSEGVKMTDGRNGAGQGGGNALYASMNAFHASITKHASLTK